MPMLVRFHFWPSLSSNPEEHLKAKARALAEELFSQEAVEDKLENARSYAAGLDRTVGWKRWIWLIDTHRTARRQVWLLKKCATHVAHSRLINIHNSDVETLLNYFHDPIGKVGTRKKLEKRLSITRESWLEVQGKIEEVRLPIAFTNVLLMVGTRSGIETTSLLIGALMAAGGIYMSYFYEAAVGISAYAYWTVEDLIVRGILMAPIVGSVLVGFEIVFILIRLVFTNRARYVLYGLTSRFHFYAVALFLIIAMMAASGLGLFRGNKAFEKFARMNEQSAQMATAMDNSQLNYAYLVGTSDRTAVFLCAMLTANKPVADKEELSRWSKRIEGNPRKKKEYWKTTKHVFGPFQVKEPNQSRPTSNAPQKLYKMVVMDRALIVCHAQQGKCPTPVQQKASLDVDQLGAWILGAP